MSYVDLLLAAALRLEHDPHLMDDEALDMLVDWLRVAADVEADGTRYQAKEDDPGIRLARHLMEAP